MEKVESKSVNRRYQQYTRKKFKGWKEKVAKHLPLLAITFYQSEKYINYEMHRLLGNVIADINNPEYAIIGYNGERLGREDEMALEIILELRVCELFRFIKTKLC